MTDLLALCYHAVSENWRAPLSVTPLELERQLRTLSSRGYRGATLSEAVLRRPAGRTVAITFDDAYRSVLELAYPILRRFGFTASVFVPTSFVGSGRPMSWPGIDHWLGGTHEDELVPLDWRQLRELAGAGWEVGSHTCTHPRLTRLDDAALLDELVASKQECEKHIRRPCHALAYPYGDHDERVVRGAEEAGYLAACTLPAGWHPSRRLSWPRVGVYHGDGGVRFWLKISRPIRGLRATTAWGLLRRTRWLGGGYRST